jgi:hypothetical protein
VSEAIASAVANACGGGDATAQASAAAQATATVGTAEGGAASLLGGKGDSLFSMEKALPKHSATQLLAGPCARAGHRSGLCLSRRRGPVIPRVQRLRQRQRYR